MTLKPDKGSKKWLPRMLPRTLQGFRLHLTSRLSYEILSQEDTREAYDRYGMEGMSRNGPGGGFGGGMDPADIFAELFGASMGFGGFDFGPGMRGPRRTKGQDSNIPYEVTLEDLYNGKTVKMNMEKEIVCGLCKGCVLSCSMSWFPADGHIACVALARKAAQSQNSASSARVKVGPWSRHR